MSVSSVSSLISLQESQLIHLLHQQTTRARTDGSAEQRRAQFALAGQNLPGADIQTSPKSQTETAGQSDPSASFSQPLDPAMSPDNISALLLALQTQQASLDTTMLLGTSAEGPGGRTLLDYLTSPETAANDAANDDGAAEMAGALA